MTEKYLQGVKDKVVVEVMSPEQVTEGGIIIPDGFKKEPQAYGRVISAGEEVGNKLKEGEIVLFAEFGGQTVLLNKKIYRVLLYNEIYGVLTDEDQDEEQD